VRSKHEQPVRDSLKSAARHLRRGNLLNFVDEVGTTIVASGKTGQLFASTMLKVGVNFSATWCAAACTGRLRSQLARALAVGAFVCSWRVRLRLARA
jgi:tRNA(Ile)-lysidine synthase TilS/MesJ